MTHNLAAKVLRDLRASRRLPTPGAKPLVHRRVSVRAAAREHAAKIANLVIPQVCHATQMQRDDLLSECRRRDLAEARQIAAWLMRQEDVSLPLIAHNLGLCDHTTVLHAVRKVDQDNDLRRIAKGIRRGDDVHDLCMRRWHAAELERQRRIAERPRSKGDLGADLVEAGTHSHIGAALEIGCCHQTVRNACKARGLPATTKIARQEASEKISAANRGRQRPASKDVVRRQTRALKLQAAGLTYREIAEELGATIGGVAGMIDRARRRAKLQHKA